MSAQDPLKYLSKYMPSARKLFLHGGLVILLSLALGYIYAMYFMDVPANLAKENEDIFRQGIGIGIGLMYLSPVFVFALIIRYMFQLFKAKKLAVEEYTKDLSEKYKK